MDGKDLVKAVADLLGAQNKVVITVEATRQIGQYQPVKISVMSVALAEVQDGESPADAALRTYQEHYLPLAAQVAADVDGLRDHFRGMDAEAANENLDDLEDARPIPAGNGGGEPAPRRGKGVPQKSEDWIAAERDDGSIEAHWMPKTGRPFNTVISLVADYYTYNGKEVWFMQADPSPGKNGFMRIAVLKPNYKLWPVWAQLWSEIGELPDGSGEVAALPYPVKLVTMTTGTDRVARNNEPYVNILRLSIYKEDEGEEVPSD